MRRADVGPACRAEIQVTPPAQAVHEDGGIRQHLRARDVEARPRCGGLDHGLKQGRQHLPGNSGTARCSRSQLRCGGDELPVKACHALGVALLYR